MFLLYNSSILPQRTIGRDCLFGHGGPGACILGELTTGQNSIVGANAVVTRDVPENSIVGGIPVKLIRTIEPGQLDVLEGRLRGD